MAKRRKSIWNEKRLELLLQVFPKTSPQNLEKRFGTDYENITNAYLFALNERRLRLKQTHVKGKKEQRAYTITIYAPAYPIGRQAFENPLKEEELP